MLTRLLGDAKQAVEARLTSAGSTIVVAACGAVALSFFTAAAFLWAQSLIGSVYASLSVGAAYLLLAGVIYLRGRARMASAARARAAEPASAFGADPLSAPAMISTGVDVLRKVGANRLIPAFILGVIAIAVLQLRESAEKNKS